MTIHELLTAARAVIDNEDKWTREYVARDTKGFYCDPESSRACTWCVQGAVWKAANGNAGAALNAIGVLDDMAMNLYPNRNYDVVETPSALINDTVTHAEVLAMFDRAIEAMS